jgi:hypothetical protein
VGALIGPRFLVVVAALIAAGGPAFGRAGDAASRSEALIQKGLSLREAGNDEEALGVFQQAYVLSPDPRAAAQLGTCEQALGRWTDAESHLIEATRARGAHPWINRNYEPLRQALEDVKAHIARIEVVGSPAGATVSVNGLAVGPLPLARPLRVNEGKVYLQLSARGYRRRTESLLLSGGQFQRVSLDLEAEGTPAPVALPAVRTRGAGAPAAAVTTEPTPQVAGDDGGVLGRWWFWTGVGAVVVGAVATAVVLSSDRASSPGCPRGVDLCAR